MSDRTPTTIDLSPTQRIVWYGQMLHAETPVYNTAYSFQFLSQIDPEIFDESFKLLVEATDSLRMVVESQSNRPMLKILDKSPGALRRVNATEQSEIEFKNTLREETQQTLDLNICPWRSTLFERPNGQFVWHLLHHHMFTDGFGFQVVLNRTGEIYKQLSNASETDISIRSEYPSYAKWIVDNKRIDSENTNSSTDTSSYSSLYSSTGPTGKPNGERRTLALSKEISGLLTCLSNLSRFASFSTELSLNLVLITTIFALLSRIERKREICIGISNHGRPSKLQKEISGLLITIDPITVALEKADTFSDLYDKVRDAYFEQISAKNKQESTGKHKQNFDVTFNYLVGDISRFGDISVKSEWIYPDCHESANRWRIHFNATNPSNPELIFDFINDAFSNRGKGVAIQNLLDTIAAFANDPDQAIDSFSLAGENFQNSSVLIGKPSSTSIDSNLWNRFKAVVENSPNAQAIRDCESDLNYSQLLGKIEAYAQHLSSNSVEIDQIVPVVGPKNSKMVQASLAAMKIGAAFLPIDARLPRERISNIIEDSEATVIIDASKPTPENSEKPDTPTRNGKTAYTIYTSGTTGAPNGVCIGHRSVLNLLEDMEERAPLSPDARCMWWTAVNFDLSIYEVYSALLYGRSLHIPPDEIHISPEKLFAWIHANEINSAYLPPFMLDPLNNWLAEHNDFPLRRLLVGVEPIEEKLLVSIAQKQKGLNIVNGYGPTETTVCATFYSIQTDKQIEGRTPIGRPLSGNRCYVLDEQLNIMPKGTVGELYIGGVGLGQGYWKRPELNEQRYIKDIHYKAEASTEPELMYKTGDLVRITDEDQLEFIGRADKQIKIRGQRIEPAEIEQTVLKNSSIKRAFATLQEIGSQEEIVCYYTSDSPIDTELMYNQSAAHLPFQLIPKRFYHFESFPTTTNGKLDLPELFKQREEKYAENPEFHENREIAKPNGPVEEHILDLWIQLFKTENISVNDSFFQLGGTSLDAMEAVLQLCNDFAVDIPLHTIFSQPRIADLAATIERKIEEEIEQLSEEEADEMLDSNAQK